MKYLKLSSIGVALMILVLGFQNCSQQNFTEPDPVVIETKNAALKTMQQLDHQINQLVDDKSCQVDDDCTSIGYGQKTCGGPARHLVYSVQATNSEELVQLVGEFNQLAAEAHLGSGMVGTCSIEEPPRVACVANQCEAKGHEIESGQ